MVGLERGEALATREGVKVGGDGGQMYRPNLKRGDWGRLEGRELR